MWGWDASKEAISVAVLPPDRDVAEVDKIFNDEESVRRLIKRLAAPLAFGPVTRRAQRAMGFIACSGR